MEGIKRENSPSFPVLGQIEQKMNKVTIRPGFPGQVLFMSQCPGVRAAFSEYGFCPGFLRSSAR